MYTLSGLNYCTEIYYLFRYRCPCQLFLQEMWFIYSKYHDHAMIIDIRSIVVG